MISPSIDLCWSISEAEAAAAGFPDIRVGHFWIGVAKAMDLELAVLLGQAPPELRELEGQMEADFLEVRGVLERVVLAPTSLRRAIRADLGRAGPAGERPLHRSDALREAFRRAMKMAQDQRERLRPAHVLAGSLADSKDDFLSGPLSALGLDAKETVSRLRDYFGETMKPKKKPRGRAKAAPAVDEAPEKPAKPTALEKFGRDLTALAADGALSPLIGRRKELLKMTQVLLQSRKNNLILLGEPGVGKTGVVEGFAQMVADGKLPAELGRPRVIEISLPALVAGTKYRGEFEQRLEAVIKEAEADPKPILFLDEIHLLMGAGSGGSSDMDAANILKPSLARGAIRVIGATTTKEYRQSIEKDGAMERRFQTLMIEEPTEDEAVAILLGLREKLEKHHGLALDESALRAAVELSVRYLPDFRLPDKALDLVDQACAAKRFQTFTPKGQTGNRIEREDIATVVAARCGIPVGTLTADEGARLLEMEKCLGERVKGQLQAITALADAIRLARAGLKKPGRPAGVFLFVGPSGTGKTELAKALAEFLFHDEKHLLRFDMSEYMEQHSVARLIGAPPGYIGHDEGGQQTDQIRTHPYSVVLFDEIEKAHPKVLDLFLQIFDEGTLTDSQGRKCSFKDAVIILTSNLGSKAEAPAKRVGFGADAEPESDANLARREAILAAVRQHLRPELINRLTRIISFDPLGEESVRLIIDKVIADLNHRIRDRGITLELEPSAYDALMRVGYSPENGAREMERAIEQWVATPLAERMLNAEPVAGTVILVSAGKERDLIHLQPRNPL
jgi:ATP-dependent Clp protease ATP-binding subunit ClpC